jgi:hypothetical protein
MAQTAPNLLTTLINIHPAMFFDFLDIPDYHATLLLNTDISTKLVDYLVDEKIHNVSAMIYDFHRSWDDTPKRCRISKLLCVAYMLFPHNVEEAHYEYQSDFWGCYDSYEGRPEQGYSLSFIMEFDKRHN